MRGSIRQRGSSYTAYWSVADPATGKRVQHTKGGFRTQGLARKHLNAIMPRVDQGEWRPEQPLTVKQLLEDHWLPAKRSQGRRPATLEQYRNVVEAWIVPNIGAVSVGKLTPKVVQGLVETLRTAKSSRGREGLSPRSAQLTVGVLKSACRWAHKTGLISRDPVAAIDRPDSQSTVMRAWDTDEARTFLKSIRGHRLEFAWSLLLTRGLRRGELCGLRWEDVDLSAGVLRINRTRVVVAGKPIDSIPKTASGRRSVPLDAALVTLLKAHKAVQAAEKLAAGSAYDDGGYLVADKLGVPLHPETISGWFDDQVKEAELPRIRLHDTRHTAASLMLATGVPVKVVSEMLGHSTPTITLSIYAHVLPGMAEEAGAALSASLLS